MMIKSLSHVLVIDDDMEILSLLAEFLRMKGYVVSVACSTKEADLLLDEFKFDLIIIDVMMNEEDGLMFLKRKREILDIPIMMLTALGGVDDRVSGLASGADDYLAKPFDPRELLLRIQKLLSRTNFYNKSLQTKITKISFGDFVFCSNSGHLTKHKNLIYLTNSESRLLRILAQNVGEVVSRESILEILDSNTEKEIDNSTMENKFEINSRTVDTQIARLRTKIERYPKHPEFLQTIRGSGYILWGSIIS